MALKCDWSKNIPQVGVKIQLTFLLEKVKEQGLRCDVSFIEAKLCGRRRVLRPRVSMFKQLLKHRHSVFDTSSALLSLERCSFEKCIKDASKSSGSLALFTFSFDYSVLHFSLQFCDVANLKNSKISLSAFFFSWPRANSSRRFAHAEAHFSRQHYPHESKEFV